MWDMDELYKIPGSRSAKEESVPGLKSLYYEGLPYKGKATEVYAYYGVPEGKIPEGGWPAIVLVHGGGGIAYAKYVKWWNQHGYAAISMDLEGRLPGPGYRKVSKSGPRRIGIWNDIEKPVKEQWFYHCIGQVVLAHSLLRSFPEVNPEKTGLIGLSWGGVITCLVVGIDDRFKFAIPVYGCAALPGSDGTFSLKGRTSLQVKRITELWEGAPYLAKSNVPILWMNGTNDINFPLDSWQKSINIVRNKSMQRAQIRMTHSHWGFILEEAVAFANGVINNNSLLPQISEIKRGNNKVSIHVQCSKRIIQAKLCYTEGKGKYSDRLWKGLPADISSGTLSAELPENTTAFFFNVTTEDNLMLSSEYIELNKPERK